VLEADFAGDGTVADEAGGAGRPGGNSVFRTSRFWQSEGMTPAVPRRAVTQESSETRGRGLRAAQAAFVVGLLYAAISVYWAVGGTWLLDTVGASLVQAARGASAGVLFAVWAAAVLKVIATVLPLLAVHAAAPPGSRWRRVLRVLTWVEAVILVLYGLVLTATGLLVQSGLVATDATADHRALRWHAYLWDPWFLVWGLLVTAALWRSRRLASGRRGQASQRSHVP
jgi:Protein of unknown function (DUF3995)